MSQKAQDSLRAIVHGRVQGVGFRFFVQEQLRELSLAGWAQNLSDGTVEVRAEGPTAQLKALLEELHRGPPLARVEAVDQQWQHPDA